MTSERENSNVCVRFPFGVRSLSVYPALRDSTKYAYKSTKKFYIEVKGLSVRNI